MKRFQLTDLISLSLLSALSVISGGAILMIVGVINNFWIYKLFKYTTCLIMLLGFIIPCVVLAYSAIRSKGQKHYGYYNFISDVVEFHIGRKVKSDIGLIKPILVMKSYAEELNKDMVFCTNLLDEGKIQRLEKRFNVKIDIYPVGKFRKVLFYAPYLFTFVWIKKFKRYPLVSGVVRISK